jgi:hypothetical protein
VPDGPILVRGLKFDRNQKLYSIANFSQPCEFRPLCLPYIRSTHHLAIILINRQTAAPIKVQTVAAKRNRK